VATDNKDFKVKNGLVVGGTGAFEGTVAVATPNQSSHATTKEYVDDAFLDLNFVYAVLLNFDLAIDIATETLAGQSIEGVTLNVNDTILLSSQTLPEENGIYIINATGPATRLDRYDDSLKIKPGDLITVLATGSAGSKSVWVQVESPLDIGVDPINFVKIYPMATEPVSEISDTLDPIILYSSLQTLGILTALNVSGDVSFTGTSALGSATASALSLENDLSVTGTSTLGSTNASDLSIENTLSVTGSSQLSSVEASSLSVSGETSLDTLDVSGEVNFSALVNIPEPTTSTNPATKSYVDNLLNQQSVEIKVIDDLANYFNDLNSRFLPTYQGATIELKNPFNLLLTIDGIIQSVGYPDYVWQSVMPRVGFRIDNDGYIAFPEAIPAGSTFDGRILVGSAETQQTKVYPFRPMDIVLGGY
jgi:hypothetical protein